MPEVAIAQRQPSAPPKKLEGDRRDGNRRRSRAEIAPAGIKAFGKADVFRLGPQRRHVNADDEAAADQRHEQPRDKQLRIALAKGKKPGRHRHRHQQNRKSAARAEVVKNHADKHPARNGQGDVGNQKQLDVFSGDIGSRLHHRGGERRDIEPDIKRQKKRDPSVVQRADIAAFQLQQLFNVHICLTVFLVMGGFSLKGTRGRNFDARQKITRKSGKIS